MLGQPFDFARIRIREAKAPELRAVSGWINTPPLSLANLRGRVVVLNFWTFGCINCLHNLPHYREWYDHLPRDQVVILGVHTPETKAEYDEAKVRRAVQEQGLAYPIAIDNQRKEFRESFRGKDNDYNWFDLTLNCMTLSVEEIAGIIANAATIKHLVC